jgi:hypothetical protein
VALGTGQEIVALALSAIMQQEHVLLGDASVRWAVLGAAGTDLRSWGCNRVGGVVRTGLC